MKVEDVEPEPDPFTVTVTPQPTPSSLSSATTTSAKQENAKGGKTEEKKIVKKEMVVQSVKVGAALAVKTGDFIGRLGTLIVMIVTTINTGTVCVTSFIEGVYWMGGVHAFLLVFIHIPVIVVMVWLMVKAKVEAVYRKIRPTKPNEVVTVTEITETEGEIIGEKTLNTDSKRKERDEKLKSKAENLTRRGQQINKAFEAA
ncbi:unnamed protein product [Lymnaea stagnalis]|uniref:Uncharacterized protein n=1 Tax=Lymnaea stagnalis TaxID=6523 RepID=A0AAV2I723_LYMST